MSPEEPTQKPMEFLPSWHERILGWGNWERLAEIRGQLLLAALVLIGLAAVGVWSISRRETTSISSVMQAQALADVLESPASQPQLEGLQPAAALSQLEKLAAEEPAIQTRFAGVLAQEQLLQNALPRNRERFAIAAEVLARQSLPAYAKLVQITSLADGERLDEALGEIETLRASASFEQSPMLVLYLLLQKACLLHEQHKPTRAVAEELQKNVDASPQARALFDHCCGDKTNEVLALFR